MPVPEIEMADGQLTLAGLVIAWYVCSLLTDLLNKEVMLIFAFSHRPQVQSAHRIPSTLTAIQFLVGGCCSSLLRAVGAYAPQQASTEQVRG